MGSTEQLRVKFLTFNQGEDDCDQRPRKHCDVSEGKETWAEKYQGAAFIVISYFQQRILIVFSFFQSTRKMVGKDEMIYTMEVVGQVGCNDQVGQPEVVCVQKFKRIA